MNRRGHLKIRKLTFLISSFLLWPGMTLLASTHSLVAESPITLPGPAGKFDFMATDPQTQRILVAHRGAKTLEIIDLKTGKTLKPVEVGAAQGVAFDSKGEEYFLGNESEHSSVTDSGLKEVSKVASPKGAHTLAIDPNSHDVWISYADDKHSYLQKYKAAP